MLEHHPIFQKKNADKSSSSRVKSIINVSEISDRYIKLAGSVTSSTKIHLVVLFDSDKAFGNYWSRSYRALVDREGSYALKVDEPFAAASGNLSLFFCIEDGRNT